MCTSDRSIFNPFQANYLILYPLKTSETVARSCSVQKVFLGISQDSQ